MLLVLSPGPNPALMLTAGTAGSRLEANSGAARIASIAALLASLVFDAGVMVRSWLEKPLDGFGLVYGGFLFWLGRRCRRGGLLPSRQVRLQGAAVPGPGPRWLFLLVLLVSAGLGAGHAWAGECKPIDSALRQALENPKVALYRVDNLKGAGDAPGKPAGALTVFLDNKTFAAFPKGSGPFSNYQAIGSHPLSRHSIATAKGLFFLEMAASVACSMPQPVVMARRKLLSYTAQVKDGGTSHRFAVFVDAASGAAARIDAWMGIDSSQSASDRISIALLYGDEVRAMEGRQPADPMLHELEQILASTW